MFRLPQGNQPKNKQDIRAKPLAFLQLNLERKPRRKYNGLRGPRLITCIFHSHDGFVRGVPTHHASFLL